jgi:hypothetical protein
MSNTQGLEDIVAKNVREKNLYGHTTATLSDDTGGLKTLFPFESVNLAPFIENHVTTLRLLLLTYPFLKFTDQTLKDISLPGHTDGHLLWLVQGSAN